MNMNKPPDETLKQGRNRSWLLVKFSGWYEWARTQCRVQGLIHQVEEINHDKIGHKNHLLLPCSCHQASPYNEQHLWSLQKAFIYAFDLFLDKSNSLAHWSYGLDSRSSSLSHARRKHMIKYAVYDVIAVTYLIRPITERWAFAIIKNRRLDEIFNSFQSTKLPPLSTPAEKKKKTKNINLQASEKVLRSKDPDLQSISSDDEIYMNQLAGPVNVSDINNDNIEINEPTQQQVPEPELITQEAHNDRELISEAIVNNEANQMDEHEDDELEQISDDEIIMDPASVNDHRVVVDDQNYQDDNARPRKQRTIESKKKRNRKSTARRRKHRYHHAIIRRIYSSFPMHLVRKILRFYQIKFTHVRLDDEDKEKLIIGLKDRTTKQEAEQILSSNIFSKNSYFYYRKKFR